MFLKKSFTFFVFFIIAILGVVIYSNTFQAEFQFDDAEKIVDNPTLKSLFHLRTLWERQPLRFIPYLTFALNYHFGKLNVIGYHLVNLFVHLCSSMLVYTLILLMLRTPRLREGPFEKDKHFIALFGALLFLTHPIQTQAVTYIVQRATSLAAFFFLASLVLYLKARLSGRMGYAIFAFLASVAAMLSKPVAVIVPFAILLCEILFFGVRKKETFQKSLWLFPFFLTLGILPLLAIRYGTADFSKIQDITRQTDAFSRTDYLFTQFNVIRTYLRLLFLPIRQNVDYHYPISHTLFEPVTFSSFLLLAAILTSAIKLTGKKRFVSFGIFLFFLGLIPESSLYPLSDVLFEHRLYLPMVGFSIFASATLYLLLKDLKRFVVASSCIILIFSTATYRRNHVWRDEVSLWEDAVLKSPMKSRPYNNLGFALGRKEEFRRATPYFQKAITLYPKHTFALSNLGVALGKQGSFDQAIAYCQKAVALDPNDPSAYTNLGFLYSEKGESDKAMEYYLEAIRRDPRFVKAYINIGTAYGKRGDYDKALEYSQKAVQADPSSADAYVNLAAAYGGKGDLDKEIEYCRKAIQLDPTHAYAHLNLGIAYGRKGDNVGVLKEINELKALKRDDLVVHLKENGAQFR